MPVARARRSSMPKSATHSNANDGRLPRGTNSPRQVTRSRRCNQLRPPPIHTHSSPIHPIRRAMAIHRHTMGLICHAIFALPFVRMMVNVQDRSLQVEKIVQRARGENVQRLFSPAGLTGQIVGQIGQPSVQPVMLVVVSEETRRSPRITDLATRYSFNTALVGVGQFRLISPNSSSARWSNAGVCPGAVAQSIKGWSKSIPLKSPPRSHAIHSRPPSKRWAWIRLAASSMSSETRSSALSRLDRDKVYWRKCLQCAPSPAFREFQLHQERNVHVDSVQSLACRSVHSVQSPAHRVCRTASHTRRRHCDRLLVIAS